MDFSSVKKGCYIRMKGDRVAKVVDCIFSKPGKHGSGKKVVTGIDVITDSKYIETFKDSSVFLPFQILSEKYQVVDIDDEDYVTLLTDAGHTEEGIKLTYDEAETVRELMKDQDVELTILSTVVDDNTSSRVSDIRVIAN